MANIPNKLTANPKELTSSNWLVFISGGSKLSLVNTYVFVPKEMLTFVG